MGKVGNIYLMNPMVVTLTFLDSSSWTLNISNVQRNVLLD